MADIDQTFTAVGENTNKRPFKGTARKKTKKASVFVCIFQLYCKFEIHFF